MARLMFLAVSPPDRMVRRKAEILRASSQFTVRPVPPCRKGSCASSSTTISRIETLHVHRPILLHPDGLDKLVDCATCHLPAVFRRLGAVQLRDVESHEVPDLSNRVQAVRSRTRRRVSSAVDFPHDGLRIVRRDVARAARPEDEPDGRRAKLGGQIGVLQSRDAANFYEHRVRFTPRPTIHCSSWGPPRPTTFVRCGAPTPIFVRRGAPPRPTTSGSVNRFLALAALSQALIHNP